MDTKPADATLCTALAESLRTGGERLAIRTGTTNLTYRDLHDRALRIAARTAGRAAPADARTTGRAAPADADTVGRAAPADARTTGRAAPADARTDGPAASADPQTVVAVMLPRGAELVAALTGVLLSGAAFLPIDPQLPLDRRLRMLAAADLCITDAAGAAAAARAGVPLLPETVSLPPMGTFPSGETRRTPHGEHLAYVMFTSGTTGTQKAVEIPHRALAAHAAAVRAAYALRPGDRVLQFAGVGFDVALEEIFPALLAGATLVLAPATAPSTEELTALLATERVTVANLPTPYWEQWVRDLDQYGGAVPDSLRLLVIGSDMGRAATLAAWRRFSQVETVNAYGLTETTVTSAIHPLTGADAADAGATLPVGTAVAGTEIVLLDTDLNQAGEGRLDQGRLDQGRLDQGRLDQERPDQVGQGQVEEGRLGQSQVGQGRLGQSQVGQGRPGQSQVGQVGQVDQVDQGQGQVDQGEVHIGGLGLARGYRGDPRLTADRFVPDPRPGRRGARLFRTGDRGALDPGGVLRILGRADDLVKIRGQRVHPQEVVRHLAAHPEVAAAHVRAETGGEGGTRLVAYLVPVDSRSVPTAGRLREHLARSLPAGHLPARYVVLDALPLLASGKVDAAALPGSQLWQRAEDVPFRAPAGATELALAEIWSRALGVDRIGADDSFFDLGGHSLAAVQIANRIRARWPAEVTVADLMAHPTVAGLAALVDRGAPAGAGGLPPIERGGDDDRVPLTAQQQQVWFLDRLSPGNIAYHAQTTMRVAGELDLGALQRAADTITARQSIFRTTFHDADGIPYQRVHATGPMPIRLVDLSHVPEHERRARVEELVVREMTTPFDLGELPLVRWTAVRLGRTTHEIILVEHHFVHDGWSFGLLMKELRAAYTAEVTGVPATLPEPAVQYADYARWQERALAGEGMRRRREHWAAALSDSPPAVTLPTSRPRSRPQSFAGGMVRAEVPARTVAALRELARNRHTTLFSAMLAGFYATLWRYTRQDDLAIGSAFGNRQLAETEDVIGMFVNAVVLRCDAGGDPSFAELLRRSGQTVRAATANQELPFLELVRALNPDRDPAANPYFQIMFSANDARMPDLELPGCSATVYERDNGSAKVDLNVVVIPRAEAEPGADGRFDGRVTLLWEYNSDLFDREFIAEVAGNYLNLLAVMAERPDARIGEVDLVQPGGRDRLLALGSGRRAGPATSFAELFAAAAARAPEAPAISTTTATLSYAEVAGRAGAVAALLDGIDAGSTPDPSDARPIAPDAPPAASDAQATASEARATAPVGVLLRRTPEALTALLGIVLSGRGYLPLDPAHPAERIAYMLADSGARTVLVEPATAGLLPPGGWTAFDVTGLAPADGPPFRTPHPAATAWVMYTSGSTGRPKGCRVTHANLAHFVRWTLEQTPEELPARTLASTALTFDVSVHELLPTLAAGGTIVLADDVFALPSLPERLVPSQVNVVASMLAELLRGGAIPAGVRAVNFVGEAGTAPLVRQLEEAGVPLVRNLYGPTETTVFVTGGPVTADPGRPWPLGVPGPGVEAYVVDPDGGLLPRGVEGELAIGGDGVCDGYLGRPRLTAECFVPDPYGGRPGGRLYLTGDRARWSTDDRLEYLGRRDHQVKIRGLRIELGEIEQVLAAHPGVAAAYAVVRGQAPAQTLVAYVRPSGSEPPPADDLDAHARRLLPSGLVPSAFVTLDEIPLTTSGKVDRARLPAPPEQVPGESPGEAPQSELERTLSGIWAEVLDVPEVNRDDNLFLLGGHSLAVLRIRHRIKESIGADLAVADLFAHPTVAELAGRVAAAGVPA
ncbi:amino acid adenylation domain-containing protein [Nonomuraea typhae]|uniref:Amino acid adenylation domain-containing protein n=1 Tax=Nonomuraea typhae TaxID=2603600 RepID=A0ABW7Z3U0_9ACTN